METVAAANGTFVFCPVPAGTYDLVVTSINGVGTTYAATVITGVQPGNALGNIPLTPAALPASISGQATSSTGSAATAVDLSLSALQPITVNSATVLITVPLAQQSSSTLSLATEADVSWALLFFPFLVLSTLRLNPVVSSVAGVAGGIGYLLAARSHGWHINSDLATNSVAHTAVPFFALMICVTGFIAALVAREIRLHFQAALREAETERALKQMEHDLSIARSIQQSLLPKVRPKLDGYEIAGWNRSADSTGGDYFDWKELENGSLVVTLADVTGHGIGPALLASVCRAYSRASFSNSDSLVGILQRINQSFGEDLAPGRFATFVAAICHAEDDKLELLSAGHDCRGRRKWKGSGSE